MTPKIVDNFAAVKTQMCNDYQAVRYSQLLIMEDILEIIAILSKAAKIVWLHSVCRNCLVIVPPGGDIKNCMLKSDAIASRLLYNVYKKIH